MSDLVPERASGVAEDRAVAAGARRARATAATDLVRSRFPHDLGVSYGPSPSHQYDLYMPRGEPAGPALVFLHPGSFIAGSRSHVAYLGMPYLERGAIFVTADYRLADEARFPASAEDVESALALIRADVARRGGDPDAIFLAGHSSGATVAAQVGLHPGAGSPAEAVKGLVLISGVYDLRLLDDAVVDREHARYLEDIAAEVADVPPHVITVSGEHDHPTAVSESVRLAGALGALGGAVERYVCAGADHSDATRTFATPGRDVAEAGARMMRLPFAD